MYISIERNNRGSLDIEINALNRLIEHSVTSDVRDVTKKIKDIDVWTDIYYDNVVYVLIKIKLIDNAMMLDEHQIYKGVEEAIFQTLGLKPKNIAIAYRK
ncbi:hypothetical protein EELLY_v1c01570 [Entomoplasma ellychniae]|uniref:Uncharacterized protein n=2 Tax=Entomoplasmataceae TaxID=33925 RepID=A0A2S5RG26_9MOLU|nr:MULTISPECIES: hypothetical protein [Entomoplasmataceae]PPE04478.1 hypothetical protein EELLY_v1c01570 [Entomoplasma ellychniae]PPE06251.1 hypothetical protein MCORR_v1c05550 [Mesoplasma corruscae]